jgi:hypothetical protein
LDDVLDRINQEYFAAIRNVPKPPFSRQTSQSCSDLRLEGNSGDEQESHDASAPESSPEQEPPTLLDGDSKKTDDLQGIEDPVKTEEEAEASAALEAISLDDEHKDEPETDQEVTEAYISMVLKLVIY